MATTPAKEPKTGHSFFVRNKTDTIHNTCIAIRNILLQAGGGLLSLAGAEAHLQNHGKS